MSAKIVKKKKSFTAIATIGIVGGISVLAFFLTKKHKVKINDIIEEKEGEKILSKTYLLSVGLRYVEIKSSLTEQDTFILNEPIYIYNFKNSSEKDKDGLPKVEVTIKNRFNKKESSTIIPDALPN